MLSPGIKNQHIKAKIPTILTIIRQARAQALIVLVLTLVLALVPAHQATNRPTRVMAILSKPMNPMDKPNNTNPHRHSRHRRLFIHHRSKITTILLNSQTKYHRIKWPRTRRLLRKSEDSRKRKVLSPSKSTPKLRLST